MGPNGSYLSHWSGRMSVPGYAQYLKYCLAFHYSVDKNECSGWNILKIDFLLSLTSLFDLEYNLLKFSPGPAPDFGHVS